MAVKDKSIKKITPKESSKAQTRKPVKNKKESSVNSFNIIKFLRDDRFHKILGLFLIIFSVFIAVSFTSYLFTWKTDDAIDSNNILGIIGSSISSLLIKDLFGVASYFFIVFFIISGLRLFMGVRFRQSGKILRISYFFLFFISISLGYLSTIFFVDNDDFTILGGAFGFKVSDILNNMLGKIGTGILLLFVLSSFLIINNILIHRMINRVGENNTSDAEDIDEKNEEEEATTDNDGFVLASDLINKPIKKKSKKEDANEIIEKDIEIVKNTVIEIVEEKDSEKIENEGFEIKINKIKQPEKEESDGVKFEIVEAPALTNNDSGEIIEIDDDSNDELEPHMLNQDLPNTLFDPTLELSSYQLPGSDLLESYDTFKSAITNEELEGYSNTIVKTFSNYGISIDKIKATVGPTVTLYEIIPAPGVRITKIKNLEDDIALSLSALGIRIIAPMPGRGTIGIEVPKPNPEIVPMKGLLESEKFLNSTYELPVVLGKTISNEIFIADLAKMPHLLMAGATGQGKSVGLNAVLVSLLYKKHPAYVKFVLVDPKKVELTLYSKIERHYLAKLPNSEEAIITDTKKVVHTLNSLCIEMDHRYELLKDAQLRNIKEYNAKFLKRKLNPKDGHHFLPYIVLVVDEFADLIMTAGKEVELPIARLAQLARAIGIHLIIATQRPSVNIITGTIKANFPARIAFRVTSKIDSRTILDASGADQLIGRGDMLFSTGNDLIRLQCPLVDTPEVENITEFIGSQRGYPEAFLLPEYIDENELETTKIEAGDKDKMFDDAARIVVATQQGSTSMIQRKLKLGYNRAGRIVDQLEAAGIVGPFEGNKTREVKIKDEVTLEELLRRLNGN
ncbi:MAG: DNA translocase FtsK [Bacteroidota bacterium]|nr:DNA translocase FtsK [Bacteroidota bacterium]